MRAWEIEMCEKQDKDGTIAGKNKMSERNQAVAALAALGNAINWDKVDQQAIIEAANQGILGGSLTEWLATKSWTKLKLVANNVFKDKEAYLEGPEFIRRAKEVTGWENGDKKAYEYYKDSAHWAEIPKDVEVLVFINTEFDSGGPRVVRCLSRHGAKWYENYDWIGNRFHSNCRVVSLTSSLDSGPKAS